MNPTQTGAAAGVIGAAITLTCWILLGCPVHDIPDVPPQLEAIATAIVAVTAWSGHAAYTFVQSLRAPKQPQQ